ncbi:uncharacterized protein LOC111180549 [Delphinapterus leucas]|uniref:Uncharacterized protein LOC111180549 n=1 Tax=Delphinapterus leucas TaxID=9749 RepID=A0A7F8KC16_DELLE|nr:uncharacterized protein LOC111180549 [Delphinapterus leucas]
MRAAPTPSWPSERETPPTRLPGCAAELGGESSSPLPLQGKSPCLRPTLSPPPRFSSLLWRGHPVTVTVTVWQLKAPGAQPDVLLPDLQHCRALHHPSLLLLTALSPSADPSGLCLLFEPVWLGPREGAPALCRPAAWPPAAAGAGGPAVPAGRWHAPGGLSSCCSCRPLACSWRPQLLLFLQAAGMLLEASAPAVPAGRWHAPGGLSSHAVQLMQPGLAKVGTNPGCGPGERLPHLPAPASLSGGHWLTRFLGLHRPQQGYPWGGPGPGPGLPPPPELYPWLLLELICGNTPAATSDLYSFCILAQEVFTGQRVTPLPAPVRPPPVWVPQSCFLTRELPRAGREGPELEAGEG